MNNWIHLSKCLWKRNKHVKQRKHPKLLLPRLLQHLHQKHLRPLERAAMGWFRSEACRQAVRVKVAHIYPAHEVDAFTERFWQLVQKWCDDNQSYA